MIRGWDELVAGALVGTARRPPALPAAPDASPLAALLAGLDPADPEAAVLEAGAALGLYRQVGWRPPTDPGPPLPESPAERRPACSEAAAYRLDTMLAGRFRPVLGEWLGLAATAGRVVPPERLPPLLEAATASTGLRAAVVEVIGERGRWLAALNPSWAWAAGGGGDEPWATGSAPARRLLLARLRSTDPEAARELLASTWATETPEDRAAFLSLLAPGLSMADEPFLEEALDDRRKEVRLAAAALLRRLPESRLAARMAARALPLVTKGAFPSEVDAAMARDGVVAKPPAGKGERAWWLHQLVAATPLRTWTDALGQPVERLVEAAGPPLRQAWAVAAAAQAHAAWAAVLLDTEGVHEPALLRALPHDRALRTAAAHVADRGLVPQVLDLLDHCPPPWDVHLSRTVVDRLAATVQQPGRPDPATPAVRQRLVQLAARLDPAIAPAATATLAVHAPVWSDVVGLSLDLLSFRAEMHEELRS